MSIPGLKYAAEQYRLYRPELVRGFCSVRSAGHYLAKPGFRGVVAEKDFLELFWGVSGVGYLEADGEIIQLSQGELFCYHPGDRHVVYAGEKEEWEHYWITFDGPGVELLIRTFGLKRAKRTAGRCPAELFEEVIAALAKIDASGAHLAESRAYELLSQAVNLPAEEGADWTELFRKEVEEHFQSGDFSVAAAARKLGVHRSTLHRLFRIRSGVSPQEYLMSYRLRQAMQRLREGVAVKQIAYECGFAGQNYFTRVFREHFGKPPMAFRRSGL